MKNKIERNNMDQEKDKEGLDFIVKDKVVLQQQVIL